MTTLSGGLYARTWNRKQPPSEKHWLPSFPTRKREQYIEDIEFTMWLLFCKMYGSEYYSED